MRAIVGHQKDCGRAVNGRAWKAGELRACGGSHARNACAAACLKAHTHTHTHTHRRCPSVLATDSTVLHTTPAH